WLAAGCSNGLVTIWDAHAGTLHTRLDRHPDSVDSVAWAPDATRLCTASGDGAHVWDAHTGDLLFTLRGHTHRVTSVAWSPNGERLCTGSFDRTVRVWDARKGTPLLTLGEHGGRGVSVAWSPNGERVSTVSYGDGARVWDARSGALVLTWKDSGTVTCVAWSPQGERLCAGWLDGIAHVWDARGGDPALSLAEHAREVGAVAETPWDEPVPRWRAHARAVRSLAWSPDGQWLCTGSEDSTARVWAASTGTLVSTLRGHAIPVTSVVWSPDGQRLCTGSYDGTARVWEARNGRRIAALLPAREMALAGPYASTAGKIAYFSGLVACTGTCSAPLALYADLCVRPDLVAAAFAGQPVPQLHIPMDTAARMVEAA